MTVELYSIYNYKLIIAYDGTEYQGWQVQPNGLSIQEVMQNTFYTFLREEIKLIGSGRTDAGVHANGQVAHFKMGRELDLGLFMKSANALLPPDIRVLNIEQVPADFHAQYSAKGKIYHYHICNGVFQNPLKRLYSLHVREKLDLNLLKEGARQLMGTHDFIAFANSATEGTASRDSIRTMKRIDVVMEEEQNSFRIEFEADGFLYKMVRNLVGALLEVASGKRTSDSIAHILASKDRRLSGKAVPPHGLFLVEVIY